jgi:hypothetical protein
MMDDRQRVGANKWVTNPLNKLVFGCQDFRMFNKDVK